MRYVQRKRRENLDEGFATPCAESALDSFTLVSCTSSKRKNSCTPWSIISELFYWDYSCHKARGYYSLREGFCHVISETHILGILPPFHWLEGDVKPATQEEFRTGGTICRFLTTSNSPDPTQRAISPWHNPHFRTKKGERKRSSSFSAIFTLVL